MAKPTFGSMSSLVLGDILAALPMEHVVRMARLGHERIAQACSMGWVEKRMNNVNLGTLVKASQMDDKTKETFCTVTILKRLYGVIVINFDNLNCDADVSAHVDLANKTPGKIHLYTKVQVSDKTIANERFLEFIKHSDTREKIYYITNVDHNPAYLWVLFPNLVYRYLWETNEDYHLVFSRQSLQIRRHIIDVIRAVCDPVDIKETELNNAKREAAENGRQLENTMSFHMVLNWRTEQWGTQIIKLI